MKKDNSFKQAARWVARMFGYKAETLFGRILWYLFATSVTVVVLILAIVLIRNASEAYRGWRVDRAFAQQQNDVTYLHEDYGNTYVSPYVIHHDGCQSYLYNTVEGKRTITGIQWICKSADDSLTVYSQDNKRGYFNMFTGEPVIPAQYEKAWVFSEGVAWVMEQGELHLIDHDGHDVIGKAFPFTEKIDGYCFHQGICPMMDRDGHIGFINKQGEWVIEPYLSYVNHENHGFWTGYDSDDNHGVLKENGDILLPFEFAYIRFDYHGEYIYVRRLNHTDQVYDFDGHLVNACSFEQIDKMEYESDEMVYQSYMDEYIRKTLPANCMKYMSSDYQYGLMDKNGNILTPPLYDNIRAIAKDRYFCESDRGSVILNDKGQECGEKL